MNRLWKRLYCLFALVVALVGTTALAGDWSMWRHDASRSAASPDGLPEGLNLQWKRQLHPPEPAFPHHLRMNVDPTYQPVAAGSTLFVPSMVTDSVTALDTRTGRKEWVFYAGGPVRFAPVVWKGRVYFTSDDGYLYCVDADTGELNWKFWGPPADRKPWKVLGNARVISRWPARGGPVLKDGIIYFGSGTWPFEGVYVFAVDARSGELLWRNEECASVPNLQVDHGTRKRSGVVPLGYMVAAGQKLIMPSGRAVPAFFERKSGKMEPYMTGWGGRPSLARGSWWACAGRDVYFNSGDMFTLRADAAKVDWSRIKDRMTVEKFAETVCIPWSDRAHPSVEQVKEWIQKNRLSTVEEDGKTLISTKQDWPHAYGPGASRESERYVIRKRRRLQFGRGNQYKLGVFRKPVMTDDMMFYSVAENPGSNGDRPEEVNYSRVEACDLTSPFPALSCDPKGVLWRTVAYEKRWQLEANLRVFMKAGDRLYAGRRGKVAALQLRADRKPRVAWTRDIEGEPAAILAADQRLFVVTRQGDLYCFGAEKREPRKYARGGQASPTPVPDDGRVSRIREHTGAHEGLCVVTGGAEPEFIAELCRASDLQVVALEPEASRVRRLRRALDRKGLYGTRAQVLHGTASSLQLPPCTARLVVTDGDWKPALARLLHPYRGAAWVGNPGPEAEALLRRVRESVPGRWSARTVNGSAVVRRAGGLPGAAPWTHESGSAGNTFSTDESHAEPPFGVLWFGGRIDDFWPGAGFDTHQRPPHPLVSRGRMYFMLHNTVRAADVYTGRPLWSYELEQSPKTRARRRGHYIARRNTADNYIVTPDVLYVFRRSSCLKLDAETGRKRGTLSTPDALEKGNGETPAWNEIRILGDALLVAAGGDLLCMDRHTGALKWTVDAGSDRVAFAAGGGKVFTADHWGPARGRRQGGWQKQTALRALDLATGEEAWQKRVSLPGPDVNPPTANWLQGKISPMPPYLSYSPETDLLLLSASHSVVGGYRGQDGTQLWRNPEAVELPRCRPPVLLPRTAINRAGQMFDPQSGRMKGDRLWGGVNGCNRPIASRTLLTMDDCGASYMNLRDENRERRWFSGIRTGCTNSLIPADGVLNAPNMSFGCQCNYPVFTSFAAFPMPQAGAWRREARN